MPVWPAVTFALVICITLKTGATNDITATLDSAYRAAQQGHYDLAIGLVQPVLDGLQLTTVEEIILAHDILGSAACELADMQKASDHFQALMSFAPQHQTRLTKSIACKHLYREIQTPRFSQLHQGIDALAKQEAEKWKMFIPFGVGQFANQQPHKAWTFLTAESLAFTIGVTTYILFTQQRASDGTFTNPDLATALRTTHWVALGAGAGIALTGIVDAIIHYRRRQKRAFLPAR